MPTASVRLSCPDGETRTVAKIGTGPIDAAYKAIDTIVQVENTLKEFMIHAVTEGIDAVGEVTVRIENAVPSAEVHPQSDEAKTPLIIGYGANNDIVVAAVKAYLSALNKLIEATAKKDEA